MKAEMHPIDPDHITVGALMKACFNAGQVCVLILFFFHFLFCFVISFYLVKDKLYCRSKELKKYTR